MPPVRHSVDLVYRVTYSPELSVFSLYASTMRIVVAMASGKSYRPPSASPFSGNSPVAVVKNGTQNTP